MRTPGWSPETVVGVEPGGGERFRIFGAVDASGRAGDLDGRSAESGVLPGGFAAEGGRIAMSQCEGTFVVLVE